MSKQTVFFLSDHTGITIEQVGHSLLVQFKDMEFTRIRLHYINNLEKAQLAKNKIDEVFSRTAQQPVVISSIVDDQLKRLIQQSKCLFIDIFDTFISPMEKAFGISASLTKGQAHGLINQERYYSRIDAVNFSLNSDDGAYLQHYKDADIIIVGVSRSGKTPTSLYMALQYGIFAANYPLTDSDLESLQLPLALQQHKDKLFGLTIDPDQLCMIRQERLPKSQYATAAQCRNETAAAEELFLAQRLDFIDTTSISIEEITTTIMDTMQLNHGRI